MKQRNREDDIEALHKLLGSDPQRYLRIMNERIERNPHDANAYYSRHFAWMRTGEPRRALDDLGKAIALRPDQSSYLARGKVHRHMGDYQSALDDFSQGESMAPTQWKNDAMGPYYQADCHARLGDESAALSCCGRLPDDFWTPGLRGAPAGNKAEIAAALRRIAIDAAKQSPDD